MTRTLASLLLAGGLLTAGQAMAGGEDLTPAPASNDGPLLWHNESLSYLWGKNYKVNPPIQQTFTLESASAWTWGDIWFFVDQINYNGKEDSQNGKNSYYGEFSPRLSARSPAPTCPSARSRTCCWPPPTSSAKATSSPTCSARASTWPCPASTTSS